MKTGGLTSIVYTFVLLFVGLSTAWPWPALFGGSNDGILIARADQSSATSRTGTGSQQPSSTTDGGSSDPSSTNTAGSSTTITGSVSGTVSGTGKASGTITHSFNKNATKTAIDPRLPPGGISMITPAAIDGMTFVKVGDQVTFQWNYTSLLVPPSYVDVVATNTINSQTYTIAANQTWQSTQAITWDTGDYAATATIPFVVATYTLMVYDANSNPTAVPSAGYLGAFSNLIFGIYTPQPYTPLNEFRCATCSGAMSMHEKQALSVLIGTCIVTVLSFTWFAAGFGAFA